MTTLEVPFFDPSRRLGEQGDELRSAADRVISGGRYVLGPALSRFEEAFAEYCGVGHAVGVGSGTDAITLALEALGVGTGDEVVAPANTCVPTIVGIAATGAIPVLADVDAATATLDPGALDAVCGPRTRAIVPVHLYGQCADMEPILAFAKSRDLRVVEDAAQAHGAEYRGARAGSLGDAAAFSFYPTKNLGGLGDGGAVVTADEALAADLRMRRNYGYERRDHAVMPGRNSRLDDLQAAMLTSQLSRLDHANARRRELAADYLERLAGCGVELPCEAGGCVHAWHLFVIRVPARDRFREALEERGVSTLVHYPLPVHRQPAFEHLEVRMPLTTAERLCDSVVSLPLYPELSAAEVEFVAAAVRDCFRATNSS